MAPKSTLIHLIVLTFENNGDSVPSWVAYLFNKINWFGLVWFGSVGQLVGSLVVVSLNLYSQSLFGICVSMLSMLSRLEKNFNNYILGRLKIRFFQKNK